MLNTDTLLHGYGVEKFNEKLKNLINSEVGLQKDKQVFITERHDEFNPEVLLTRAILSDKTENGNEYDVSITVRRSAKRFCPKLDTINAFRVLYETDWDADNDNNFNKSCKFSIALSYNADNKTLTYTQLYNKYKMDLLVHTVCFSVTEHLDSDADKYVSHLFNLARKHDGIHNTKYKVLYTDLDTIHILSPLVKYGISEALELLYDTITLNN
jgi:hypothetical protein